VFLALRIERLRELLAELGPLVDGYETGDAEFPERSLAWLGRAEKVMAELRLPECAELASLRGAITKSANELPDRVDGGRASRRSRQRARSAAAADALERAESIMRERMLDAERELHEYEGKLVEAITAAVLIGIVPLPPRTPREPWLAQVWTALAQHEATRPTTIYLASTLHGVDRLWLLDAIFNRLFDTELPVFDLD
jgi:hypothetical protein